MREELIKLGVWLEWREMAPELVPPTREATAWQFLVRRMGSSDDLVGMNVENWFPLVEHFSWAAGLSLANGGEDGR